MKQIACLITCLSIVLSMSGQIEMEFFGLDDNSLTSLDINYNLIVVGTDRKGVHWQPEPGATDTGWTSIRMDSSIHAVYPHKSGALGWAISAGIYPANAEPPYVYCSFVGEEFEPNSDGIEPTLTSGISDLDGFPDPTICGETYAVGDRVLYRRSFADTIWQPVFTATIEGYLQAVKVEQEYPGIVLAGGADGFAGYLLIKSLDFGETWDDISPPGMIYDIDFAGTLADTIFAAAADKIFRTIDGGIEWIPVFQANPGVQITEIIYDAESNVAYAAGGMLPQNEAFLLQSTDMGMQWEQIQLDGLGTILGLEFGSEGWVYFITRDEGVFRFREASSGTDDADEVRSALRLIRCYPNPVKTIAHLEYEILQSADVEIALYDVSGRRIALLEKTRKAPGKHVTELDASKLNEGLYVISLTAAGRISYSRLAVIR